MAGPNVVTRGRAKQLSQLSSNLSSDTPITRDVSKKCDVSRDNIATQGRARQRKPSTNRLSSSPPTVITGFEDDEKSKPSVSTRARDKQHKRSSGHLPPKSLSSTIQERKLPRPNVTTRRRVKQLRESFRKFPRLPLELRCRIWQEASPGYGIYPVNCHLEPDANRAPWMIFRLKPLGRYSWDPEFSERIRTTRVLLATCRESRNEVCFLFPDTLSCHGGKMRLNGKKDVVMIIPSRHLDQYFMLRPALSHFTFAEHWNTTVQKLGIFSLLQQDLIGTSLFSAASMTTGIDPFSRRYFRRLMRFLLKFDGLKQLVLADGSKISVCDWNKTSTYGRQHHQSTLSECYWTTMSITQPRRSYFPRMIPHHRLRSLAACASNLERVIHGNPPANLSQLISQQISFGYPQLQSVEIVKLLTLDPELGHLSQEMEFR